MIRGQPGRADNNREYTSGERKGGPQGVLSMPGGSVHTVSGTGDVTGGLALAVQHTVPLDPYRLTSIVIIVTLLKAIQDIII